MYTKNNKTYSDAGHYLASGLTIGYELPSDMENIEEKPININDMELRTSQSGSMNAHCTDGLISFGVKAESNDTPDRERIKEQVMKARYSDAERIDMPFADDSVEYQRMMDWRSFAIKVANKIMLLLGDDSTTDLEEAKRIAVENIKRWDKSESVNEFYYGGNPFWIDKSTRVGLVNSTQMEIQAGRETTTLILGSVIVELPCETVLQMLAALECYAKDCYNVTARHLIEVSALESVEEVVDYDYKGGYPEKLRF